MLVLIADDDPSFCAFVLQVLEGSDFEAHDVSDDAARLSTANAIVILGGTWCDRRLAALSGQPLILAALDEGDARGLERALLYGADDVIYKPISPRALLGRLAIARHRLLTASRPTRSAQKSLEETLLAGSTGLVVVRGSEHSGAVHVHDGGIAWVESAGREVSLNKLLGRFGVEIDREASIAVLGEARQTGKHFTEVLVDWGLVDAHVVRECVRCHLVDEIALLLDDPGAGVMFMPYDRARASVLSFAPDEILPSRPSESGIVPAPRSVAARTMQTVPSHALMALHGVAGLPGCVGATLMDRAGGRLAAVGEPLDTNFAWSVVHTMKGAQPSLTIEENNVAHIARPLDEQRMLIAIFSLRDVNLGLARTSMINCCTRAAEGTLVLDQAASFG